MSNALLLASISFVCLGAAVALLGGGPVRSRAVVTGVRATGVAPDGQRAVELDLMISRPDGGQFPARKSVLIPASSLANVSPGSVIDTYYRPGAESTIVVTVPRQPRS